MESQATNVDHFRACHRRWVKKIHRDLDGPNRPPIWGRQQCMLCSYYVPLTGVFIDDYGVCSNPTSQFDGTLMFEHDGCEQFIEMNPETK